MNGGCGSAQTNNNSADAMSPVITGRRLYGRTCKGRMHFTKCMSRQNQHHQQSNAERVDLISWSSVTDVVDQQALSSRRQWLLVPFLAATATMHLYGAPVFAASTILQYEESKLPKEYQELSSKLTRALIEAIELDLDLAPEREVRRSADQAKGLVKEWIANWRDNRMVTSSASHKQIKGSIQELGRFYTMNGQRARLSSETGKDILEKLNAALAALPI